jgi:nucleoid DNA-binding protein
MRTQANSKELDKQLISEYARREDLSVQEAERQIQSMIDVTRDVLMLTSRVRLRRFGEFYLGDRKNAKHKNNHTGMIDTIPIIKVIRFRPARSLKQEVNEKTKKKLMERFKC